MNKYLKLIEANTPYAKRMTRLRNRIFGDVVKPTDNSSMKVVRMLSEEPLYKQNAVINYYPRHRELSALMKVLRHHGLYQDEHEDFKEEMERLRAAKGKGKQPFTYVKPPQKSSNPKPLHPLELTPLYFKVELK